MAYGVYDEILQSAENYARNAENERASEHARIGNLYMAAGLTRAALIVAAPYDRDATAEAGALMQRYIKRAREIAGLPVED